MTTKPTFLRLLALVGLAILSGCAPNGTPEASDAPSAPQTSKQDRGPSAPAGSAGSRSIELFEAPAASFGAVVDESDVVLTMRISGSFELINTLDSPPSPEDPAGNSGAVIRADATVIEVLKSETALDSTIDLRWLATNTTEGLSSSTINGVQLVAGTDYLVFGTLEKKTGLITPTFYTAVSVVGAEGDIITGGALLKGDFGLNDVNAVRQAIASLS